MSVTPPPPVHDEVMIGLAKARQFDAAASATLDALEHDTS